MLFVEVAWGSSVVDAEKKVASREGVVRRSSARLQRDWCGEEGRVEDGCCSKRCGATREVRQVARRQV